MVLGEDERKISRQKAASSRKAGGESSQYWRNTNWIKPAVVHPKTHPFPSHPTEHPESNERCSSPSQGGLPELTKTDEPQIRINNRAVNKARRTREGMGTEKGKFQAGLMMERELHWSRGSHTAQHFVPSGGEGFGRSDVSQGIQMPVKIHWHLQSASVLVLWGLDGSRERSRNNQYNQNYQH